MAAQASSQYRKISESNTKLWTQDSPVIVEKSMLQYDRVYGTNVLQITFRNVSTLNIYGLSVMITLKNNRGSALGQEISYNYYGMEVEPNQLFGAEEDIVVEKEAARFEIRVVRAELSDGQVFRGNAELTPMPPAAPLSSLGDMEEEFVSRVQELQPKLKVVCAPEKKENYWRCVCERIYPNDFDSCSSCKINADDLFAIIPAIKKERKKQEEEEAQAEKEREEEENRQREELARLEEIDRLRREEEERKKREQEEEEARKKKEEEEQKAKEAERLALEKKKKAKKIWTLCILFTFIGALLAAYFIWGRPLVDKYIAEHSTEATTTIATEPAESTTVAPTEATTVAPTPEIVEDSEKILILGEKLSVAGENTIWRLFGEDRDKITGLSTITVSTMDGHRYLDAVLGSQNVEKEAISSMLITLLPEGSGIDVTLYNIDYCTRDMFEEALKKLGITDAKVVVAAPVEVSGSTALAGLQMLSGHTAEPGEDIVIGYVVSKNAMNIRKGPSTEYEIIEAISSGTVLSVVEVLSNGWYRILWENGEDGFAYTSNSNGNYYEDFEFSIFE